MKPKPKVKEKENIIAGQQSDIEIKKKLFPGLALPNDPSVRLMSTPVSTNAQVHTNTHLGAQIHTYSCTHRHTCFSSFLMNHVIEITCQTMFQSKLKELSQPQIRHFLQLKNINILLISA